MSYYEDESVDRAVNAYSRRASRGGQGQPQQPSRHLSRREGDLVILENARGELARYRIYEDGRLQRLQPVKV